MEPHSLFKFKLHFVAFYMLFVYLMAVVKSSPIVFESDVEAVKNIKDLENVSIIDATGIHPRSKRAATADKRKLWDFGVIPYVIDYSVGFDYYQIARFREAMNVWESVSCIKFVERNANEHSSFIRFTALPCGCCSSVGKVGYGGQDVSIDKGCHTQSTILHELGHAIGFHHEHQRPDRDEIISIQTQYIAPGKVSNFNKLPSNIINSLGEPYDLDSIMQYESYSFGNGGPTIVAKPRSFRNPFIYEPKVLSPIDIRQTNKLYNCPMCRRTFHEHKGFIVSSDYHIESRKALQCEWLISMPYGRKIDLAINTEMLVSTNCERSFIEIRDGYWHKSRLLGRFCGNNSNLLLKSTGNRMIINYVRDTADEGFAAAYASY